MNTNSITRAQAGALLFGAAAVIANPLCLSAQSTDALRVLAFPSENTAEPFFAKDMGFFAKARLDANVTPSSTDSATVAAVLGGSADIGYSSVGTIASAHAKGLPITVIAPASEYAVPETRGLAAVFVPANSTVRSAKDLNGKTFAVPGLGAIAYVGARDWMDKNGGDSSTVKFVEIPYPAETDLLNSGRFDAAFITEPFVGGAKKVGRLLDYGYTSIAKQFTIGTWFTTRQWATDHPDIVRNYAAVMRQTATWANKNHDQSGVIFAKYAKIDPQTLAGLTRSHYGERIDTQLMQPIIDSFARYIGFNAFPASELIFNGKS